MKRSPALAGLSRDHHEALAVALRLKRATDTDASAAKQRLADYLARIGEDHFDVEEEVLLEPLATTADGAALGARMVAEHRRLRTLSADLAEAAIARLHELGAELDRHVRFEERELFPHLEHELTPAALAQIGAALAARGHG